MEIKYGDILKYSFPFAMSNIKNNFVGQVDYIGDDFIFIKNSSNMRLKILFKNFNHVKKLGSLESHPVKYDKTA